MSNDTWDVNDDEQTEAQGPANLRKAYKELKTRFDESETALKKAQDDNANLAKKYQSTERRTLLQGDKFKGVPAGAKRWMERDKVEPTEEAITQWLTENGEDFGYKPGQATEQTAQEEAVPTQQGDEEQVVDPFLALNGSSPGGTGSVAGEKLTDLASRYKDSGDVAKLLAEYKASGIPVETTRG